MAVLKTKTFYSVLRNKEGIYWIFWGLGSVHNTATFPMSLLKSSKKVVIWNKISSK